MDAILAALGVKESWELISILSVIGAHMIVMWKRTKVANEYLSKIGALATVLMAKDANAKIPDTPYVLTLIDKFHNTIEEVGTVHLKVDRIIEHLNIPHVHHRRSNHD